MFAAFSLSAAQAVAFYELIRAWSPKI